MAEESKQRVLAIGYTDEFVYIGSSERFGHDKLVSLPTLRGIGATVVNGVHAIEGYYDRSESIGLWLEQTPELWDSDASMAYAETLAVHLGGAIIHPEIKHVGPGSIIGQVVYGREPSYRSGSWIRHGMDLVS